MNEIIKSINDRKSCRQYTDEKISYEDKQTILAAASAAPSAGNMQMYAIIDVVDQNIKDKLSISCGNQPFIASAQMVLVFLADSQKWHNAYKSAGIDARHPDVGDLMLSVSDAVIAAQNAVVAAESLGIGSCYIGHIIENYELHSEILALPEYVFPATMLVFGHPTQQQIDRKKPNRCAIEHIVHTDKYKGMEDAELQQMVASFSGALEYKSWLTRLYDRKFASDSAIEMSRSAAMYIKNFSK